MHINQQLRKLSIRINTDTVGNVMIPSSMTFQQLRKNIFPWHTCQVI
jgi:hypothetical protein